MPWTARKNWLIACSALALIASMITVGIQRFVPLSIQSSVGQKEAAVGQSSSVADLDSIQANSQRLTAILQSGRLSDADGIGVVFISKDCPISNATIPELNRIFRHFGERVSVYGVYVNAGVNEAGAHAADFDIEFPVAVDQHGSIQSELNPTHTPMVFLLDSQLELVYSGAIDNQFPALTKRRPAVSKRYLHDAAMALTSGSPIQVTQTEPVGCRITISVGRERSAKRPTLQPAQIAGESATVDEGIAFPHRKLGLRDLFQKRCVNCHRPGAVAPFSLQTYEEIAAHADQIQVVVQHRLMPPWKPRVGYGRFRNELALAQHEIDSINKWIEDGMPRSAFVGANPANGVPNQLATSGDTNQWQLGQPDLVLSVAAPFEVPASGPDVYQYFVIPTGLTEDRLVSAIEYRPGNPRVVHHASFRYDDQGNARNLDDAFPGQGYQRFGDWGFLSGGTLGGWALGVLPERMPTGYGRPIKAGSDLVIQTHYHPSGKAETDQARVGIYFAPKTTTRRIAEIFVADMNLHIPPGARSHRHSASYTLPMDVQLHSILPHAHLLAREVKVWATVQSQGQRTEIPLIHIDDWDFNWQSYYFFAQPISLPAGATIQMDVTFDNSVFNPLNPRQIPKWVHWGEDSSQEMAVCFFDVTTKTDTQLDQLVRHNRDYIMHQEGNGQVRFRR